MKPVFQHDCDLCKFLGHHNGHDMYFCLQGRNSPTVLARYGNDGPDYTSGLELAAHVGPLRVAKVMAEVSGYLPVLQSKDGAA